jgi:uncharacterized membrane protein
VNTLLDFGRVFLAIPIAAFGIQYFVYGHLEGGLPVVPPWVPGGSVLAYVAGAILLALSAGLLIKRHARLSAVLLGAFLFFCVLFLHTLHVHDIIHRGNDRTRAVEPMALAAAAWVLAGAIPAATSSFRGRENLIAALAKIGRCIFAFALIVFGIQHFMYAEFIATLITSWIPGKLFWTYLTGVGMIAVALAIITGIYARFACLTLAAMFFLWVLVLHAPLVATHLNNGNQWSSLFVAMAMGAASLILAATAQNHRQPHRGDSK